MGPGTEVGALLCERSGRWWATTVSIWSLDPDVLRGRDGGRFGVLGVGEDTSGVSLRTVPGTDDPRPPPPRIS